MSSSKSIDYGMWDKQGKKVLSVNNLIFFKIGVDTESIILSKKF